LCFVLSIYAAPVPPAKSWPPVWHTWVVTTVYFGNELPLYNYGQNIAFDGINSYSCRYNQQNLLNLTTTRAMDVCSYNGNNNSYHWGVNDTTFAQSTCSKNYSIPSSIPRLSWPSAFLEGLIFIGVDKVGQLKCNHWSAKVSPVVQLDVWTSVDRSVPCQIAVFDTNTTYHTVWAFDGFDNVIPQSAINQCGAAKLLCLESNWQCQVKPNATDDKVIAALEWVCNPANLDCTPINPGGEHYYPNTVRDHADWAFNAYYDNNRIIGGATACDFGGTAQLVAPSNSTLPSHKSPHFKVRDWNNIFFDDLVCDY